MSLADKLRKAVREKPKRTWKLRPEILCGGNIPQPLHGVAPRTILGAKWWDATRKAAYKSTDYHCLACGVHKSNAEYHRWLEGHELYDVDYVLGRMVYLETVPLCHFCHNYIHDGRLKALLEKGYCHQAKYVAIIQHGDAVLKRNKLTRTRYEGPFAEWSDWRMVLDGKEYQPRYKSLDEWSRAHG